MTSLFLSGNTISGFIGTRSIFPWRREDVPQGSDLGLKPFFEAAGILIGDILVEFGGAPVADTDALQAQLGPSRIGQATPAAVLRGGERKLVTVTVGERA